MGVSWEATQAHGEHANSTQKGPSQWIQTLDVLANNYTATAIVYITEHMFTTNKLPINLFISSKLAVCEQLQNLTMLYFNWEFYAQ